MKILVIRHPPTITPCNNTPTIDGVVLVRVDHDLCRIPHSYIRRDFCSGQNQKAKVLKIAANSYRSLVLSSKAAAYKSLISDRKPDHKV